MLHYFAKDFYAPVIASSYVENGKIKLFVVSDLMKVTASYISHDETKILRNRPFYFRGGYGWFGLGNFTFLKPLVKEFFPDIQCCKIFSSIIHLEREICFFFSVGIFSPTYFLASQFAGYFFLKLPISPLESQMVAPNVLFKLQT